MKDPDVVCSCTLPNSDFPVVKKVDWHELGRVGTEFSVVCVLEHMSWNVKMTG